MLRWVEFFLIKFERLIKNHDPIRVLALGYLTYMVAGFALLLFPFSQSLPVSFLDNLFTAVSAVSTTGLVTVTPGDSYTAFGETIILLLIQLSGIGYMTFGSFIVLQTGHRLSKTRANFTRTAFPLPEKLNITSFLKGVIYYSLLAEILGAVLLSYIFWSEGVQHPVWSGIFHSVSAFCTAGFSLFPNSFEGFTNHTFLNLVISLLSLAGAMGFIVSVDLWLKISGRKKDVFFTTKVITSITGGFLLLGTGVLFFFEPSYTGLPIGERLLSSFFQTMTSTTTVGFNTTPIGSLSPAIILILYFLMIFGASPSGTGGGLKSTTFSALFGLVKSTLKRRSAITFMGNTVPIKRLQFAASSFVFCFFVLGLAIFLLCLTEKALFETIVFEAISALGTVGLSMGLTSSLTPFGKVVIILLMVVGRLGVLSFGLAISSNESDVPIVKSHEDLVI